MLELKVYDNGDEIVLRFEHSLRSLSKWESKFLRPFSKEAKQPSELIDYFQCMLLEGQDVDLVLRLTPSQLKTLLNYVNDSQTASSVPRDPKARPSAEIVTSELIYYWMVALNINWEAQDWHLSRLMMLIEILNFKQQPAKKRDGRSALKDWASLNARNKERYGTTG